MLTMEIAKRSGMTFGEWHDAHADSWIETWDGARSAHFTHWSTLYRHAEFREYSRKYWDQIDNPDSVFAHAVRGALRDSDRDVAGVAARFKVSETDLRAQIVRWIEAGK